MMLSAETKTTEHRPTTGRLLQSSLVVIIDGEARCGKTSLIEAIKNGASRYFERLGKFAIHLTNRNDRTTLLNGSMFNKVTTISAGNAYRALALAHAISAYNGDVLDFEDEETKQGIIKMLEVEGVEEILQTDEGVARSVSNVAAMPGSQDLCRTIFTNMVSKAYNHNNGVGNLVIVDARNPLEQLVEYGVIGEEEEQIHPLRILHLFLDTPLGALEARGVDVTETKKRRYLDRNRKDHPFVMPNETLDRKSIPYALQHLSGLHGNCDLLPPFRVDGASMTLDDVEELGYKIAVLAHDLCMLPAALQDPPRGIRRVLSNPDGTLPENITN
jgi:hypothetical protein